MFEDLQFQGIQHSCCQAHPIEACMLHGCDLEDCGGWCAGITKNMAPASGLFLVAVSGDTKLKPLQVQV